jgi:hypothetical protein
VCCAGFLKTDRLVQPVDSLGEWCKSSEAVVISGRAGSIKLSRREQLDHGIIAQNRDRFQPYVAGRAQPHLRPGRHRGCQQAMAGGRRSVASKSAEDAAFMDEAGADVLDFMSFPKDHWLKILSINFLERSMAKSSATSLPCGVQHFRDDHVERACARVQSRRSRPPKVQARRP